MATTPFSSFAESSPLLRAWSVRANGHLGSYVAPMLNVDGNRTAFDVLLGIQDRDKNLLGWKAPFKVRGLP